MTCEPKESKRAQPGLYRRDGLLRDGAEEGGGEEKILSVKCRGVHVKRGLKMNAAEIVQPAAMSH